jgi:GABA(A) receptor-associated protein
MQGLKYLFKKKPDIPTNRFNFKVQYSFDKRKEEAERILGKHCGKVPIIVEKADNTDAPEIDKQKWLVEDSLTIGQFLLTIRRRIKIDATETIFMFVNNSYIPGNNETIGQVYSKHKDADLFLYMTYAKEMAYGC